MTYYGQPHQDGCTDATAAIRPALAQATGRYRALQRGTWVVQSSKADPAGALAWCCWLLGVLLFVVSDSICLRKKGPFFFVFAFEMSCLGYLLVALDLL